jgi:type II secretory pathway pseudopilin PulG
MKFNKGAMFGLDARIALAIFGALSVISGAALYSAIQEAKITAIITEIDEISKATQQLYLDTGSPIPGRGSSTATDRNTIYSSILIKNYSIDGWNGPYISYKADTSASDYLYHPSQGTIRLYKLDDSKTWKQYTDGFCSTGSSCSLWILLSDADMSIINELENRFDNSVNDSLGNIRYQTIAGKNQLYKKLYPIKNPN